MYQNPNNRLANQTCIVTGANSGIGRAIATAMAREGATVVVNYVSNESATDEVLAEITGTGGTAIGFKADVSQEEEACWRCLPSRRSDVRYGRYYGEQRRVAARAPPFTK